MRKINTTLYYSNPWNRLFKIWRFSYVSVKMWNCWGKCVFLARGFFPEYHLTWALHINQTAQACPYHVPLLSPGPLGSRGGGKNDEINIHLEQEAKIRGCKWYCVGLLMYVLAAFVFIRPLTRFSFRTFSQDGNTLSFPGITLWFPVILSIL